MHHDQLRRNTPPLSFSPTVFRAGAALDFSAASFNLACSTNGLGEASLQENHGYVIL